MPNRRGGCDPLTEPYIPLTSRETQTRPKRTLSCDAALTYSKDKNRTSDQCRYPLSADNIPLNISKYKIRQISNFVAQAFRQRKTLRKRWRNKGDYILSCFGFALGLPTVWRFPYICYQNGGGSFLLAFLVLALLVGVPMYKLELSLGQIFQASFVRLWPSFSPRFSAFGFSSVILASVCFLYFSVINSWSLIYFFQTFQSTHPWTVKGNTMVDSALRFFLFDVLHKSPSISDASLKDWNWQLVMGLFFSCFLTFLATCGGRTRTGLIAAFSALFPIFALFALLLQVYPLPGSEIGLRYFLIPSFRDFLALKIWREALIQVFFSCGIGWGSLVNYASYLEPENDFAKDAWIVLVINVTSSLLGGLCTFGVLGNMAANLGLNNIENVIQAGSGLIFVIFPTVLNSLHRGVTIIFFLLVVSLGLSSVITMLNLLQTSLDDANMYLSNSRLNKLILSVLLFALALPLTLPNGVYLVDLLDSSTGSIALLLVPVAEIVAITRLTRFDHFLSSVRLHTGVTLRFNFFLKYLLPWLLLGVSMGGFEQLISGRNGSVSVQLDPPSCVEECNDHGFCDMNETVCVCEYGWAGRACTIPIEDNLRGCPEECNKRGICDGVSGFCKCNAQFYGISCRGELFRDDVSPPWTRILQWLVAVGSLLPCIIVALSESLQRRLMDRMMEKKGIMIGTAWFKESADEDLDV